MRSVLTWLSGENKKDGNTYLIAGLGNPGKDYRGTRHNVGFETLDRMADKYGINVNHKKFKGLYGTGNINGNKVILLKPQTFMNLSGESIRPFLDYFGIDPKDHLIVICDDIALDVGRLRVRQKGSAGGHNGLKNIIQKLGGSNEFIRIRVGVGGKPDNGELVNHVLGRFSKSDAADVDEAKDKAADAAAELCGGDVGDVMTKYNRRES